MGRSKYLNSLTVEEDKKLREKLMAIQHNTCFICGLPIDTDLHNTNIDHIRPLANGGKDDLQNFAITHEACNKSKQDADLEVARALCKLDQILGKAKDANEVPSLKHVLKEKGGSKYSFKYTVDGEVLKYSFDELGDVKIRESEIFTDELSGEKSAFIKVPIEYLYHDEIINPRGINSSISLLIKEFHKPNPQLHLCLAVIKDGKISIFDGQHKTVAQIMLGIREIVLRLFIEPDIDRLTETNTIAGSKLRQIAFDKSIMRQLHDTLYAERIRKYQADHTLQDDDYSFSENAIAEYFKGERGSIKTYIINSQKNGITRSENNRLQAYISFEGRGNTLPLSYSTFEKTLLSTFVNANTVLITPINYLVEEGLNPRILEKTQLIELCNIIADELLVNRFDTNIGTYKIENKIATGAGDDIPDEHLAACRIFKEEIMYNWIKYIERLIKNQFAFTQEMYDEDNLFQQKFSEKMFDNIRAFIRSLRDLPLWVDRSMASTVFGGKNTYDYWKTIFNTGKSPDGSPVLATPLSIAEMIKK